MNIYWLDTPAARDPRRVGGKAAQLGRLAAAHPVPPGFCLAARPIQQINDPHLAQDLAQAYAHLGQRCGLSEPPVAVRSSAVDEDGLSASLAGQYESYLNVIGAKALRTAVQRCLNSAQVERARHYRRRHGLGDRTCMAVLIQQLVMADVSAVVFSADPCSSDRQRILINAAWGLGESLVGGAVTPDLYVVDKADLSILSRHIADKTRMTVARPQGTQEVAVPRCLRREPALHDSQIVELARLACTLETTQGQPVDLECAYQANRLYLLQCRPITTIR